MNKIDSLLYCFGGLSDTSINQKISLDIRTIDGELVERKTYFNTTADYAPFNAKGTISLHGYLYGCPSENSKGYMSPLLVKYSPLGDTIYTKSFDFGKTTYLSTAKLHYDSTLLFAGFSIDSTGTYIDGDIAIVNIDTLGNVLWFKEYGGHLNDKALSLELLPDSGIFVAGYATNAPNLIADAYLLKLDRNGNFQWDLETGGDGGEGYMVSKLNNGNYMLYGTYDSTQSQFDDYIRISEIDFYGNYIWDTIFSVSDSYYDELSGFQEVSDGYLFSGISLLGGWQRGLLVKLNKNRKLLWKRLYYETFNINQFREILVDSNENIFVAGYVHQDIFPNYQDSWLLHLNCLGYDTLPRSRIKVSSDTTVAGESFQILNQSKYAEEYLIDYGDGTSDVFISDPNLEDPSQVDMYHIYNDTGVFVICLKAIACGDTTISYDTVYVLPQEVVPPPQSLVLYPNPGKDMITILDETAISDGLYSILFHSSDGSLVEKINVSGSELIHGVDIYTQSWAAGIYIANIRMSNHSETTSIKFSVIDN